MPAMNHSDFVLKMHMELVVPLLMHDIDARGGLAEDEFAILQAISDDWQQTPSLVDTMIRQAEGAKNARTNPQTLHRIAEGLAILAFLPGGVTFLGSHWEKKSPSGAEQ